MGNLDAETLKRLAPALKEAQRQTEADLERLPPDRFSYQQKQHTLHVITGALREVNRLAVQEYEAAASAMTDLGVDVANEEVREMNKTRGVVTQSVARDALSLQENKYLVNNFKASMDRYSGEARLGIKQRISVGTIAKENPYTLTTRLAKYLATQTWRAARIVRTELARLFNETKLVAYKDFHDRTFPDLKKTLIHRIDRRTAEDSLQLAALNPIIPLDQPFVFTYKHVRKNGSVRLERRVFMTPPDRPNDRAALLPWREAWR